MFPLYYIHQINQAPTEDKPTLYRINKVGLMNQTPTNVGIRFSKEIEVKIVDCPL